MNMENQKEITSSEERMCEDSKEKPQRDSQERRCELEELANWPTNSKLYSEVCFKLTGQVVGKSPFSQL